jgi:hypothetical protein
MRLLAVFAALACLAGCVGGGEPSGLPVGATLVEEKFLPIHFDAPADGRVYVYNLRRHRLAFEADVRRGQAVWLDVVTGGVGVDMKRAGGVALPNYDRYQVFFLTRPE